jgi:hypothetical protein
VSKKSLHEFQPKREELGTQKRITAGEEGKIMIDLFASASLASVRKKELHLFSQSSAVGFEDELPHTQWME